ncbi:hypothetical protein RF11_13381 [Thelohanellus kitauei]|uniref:Uncharacterized protein n=1 Tax=Thelohanellus kitauei TaxID=669202 RepID=A0A0C2M767_THEKT|nr:hypothetical protein RF11_13381 [Thelohanellus kitauei]
MCLKRQTNISVNYFDSCYINTTLMMNLNAFSDLPLDPTSLSTPSPAIGAGLSGPGKHRAGRKAERGKKQDLTARYSGYKSPEDGKAAKGLRSTKAWSRPLRCLDSCATAVATGAESPDAEGSTSSST